MHSNVQPVYALPKSQKRLKHGFPWATELLDQDMVERGAQSLYEFVFANADRLDGKHVWSRCDEKTKEGFRREASAVIHAVFAPLKGNVV